MGLTGILIIVSFVIIIASLYISLLINKMRIMRENVTRTEEDFTQIIEKLVESKLDSINKGDNKNE